MAAICANLSATTTILSTAQVARANGGGGSALSTVMCGKSLKTSSAIWGTSNASSSSFVYPRRVSPAAWTITKRRARMVVTRAIASPVRTVEAVPPGFSQIAEPIPDGLSLNDIVKTLPPEVFQVDDVKAWKTVITTVAAVAAGYAALAVSPWYLYPLVYAFLGTAVTGLFVIGHDCGHLSFSSSKLMNDVVGTIAFAPLIYPFEPWRIKHNTHHAHTNKLVLDTAWQPFKPMVYDNGNPVLRAAMHLTIGPLWWIASVGHWLHWHFDLSKYKPQDQAKVKVSLFAVCAFAAGVLLPLLVTQGPVGLVKWWLVPWLGFHFWMSTFTMVHHTAPHIPFKQSRDWNAAEAQLTGTVHCDYPAWIDFLCHDISVHIPHHISTRIPSYNLRMAYDSIQRNFDRHLNKASFGPQLMSYILSNCHLFDPDVKDYVNFNKARRPVVTKNADAISLTENAL